MLEWLRRGRSHRIKGFFSPIINKALYIDLKSQNDCILPAGHKGPWMASHNFNAWTETFGNYLVQSPTGKRTSVKD